jgi:hypothetical protein
MPHPVRSAVVALSVWAGLGDAAPARGAGAGPGDVPVAAVTLPTSELRELVDRYSLDRAALLRRHPHPSSPERTLRLGRFYGEWQERVDAVPFEPLGVEGRIDHLLLRRQLDRELREIERLRGARREIDPWVPFHDRLHALDEARLRMDSVDAPQAAGSLDALAREVEALRKERESAAGAPEGAAAGTDAPRGAARAQRALAELKQVLGSWYEFYGGYDPEFTWWASEPYQRLVRGLDDYRKHLREKVLGLRPEQDDPVVGSPAGREAIAAELESELVAHGPAELIELAGRELAWCEDELKKASREMGLGDDWKAALAKVKADHVEPGRQPDLIRDLAREAEEYLERHDLVTVPPLAKEVWRMRMMSPERQKVNPFFTGGEVISVSFPTDGMDHADKLMSLRGNNVHFARATVFHELIPGHHLQAFLNARHNSHRGAFNTPFWREGWALYWEMLLWDRGFAKSPENRVGMLFWRMHRAARIAFSLRFHLGEMTPEECVDFLVERVGHERANAEAEVRRSFEGSYGPLYQLAYMVGGLQFRALRKELVEGGRMSDREFHDAVLTGGPMPVELVRARLFGQAIAADHRASWREPAGP